MTSQWAVVACIPVNIYEGIVRDSVTVYLESSTSLYRISLAFYIYSQG